VRYERSHVLKILVVSVHVLATLILMLLILLHAGRGGGLSDLLGGGGGASLMGSTVVERNLDRYTIVTALAFAVTSVTLVFLFAAPR
jgi:preprotein translocase subunit SecG